VFFASWEESTWPVRIPVFPNVSAAFSPPPPRIV
jgi:hypothetical protein